MRWTKSKRMILPVALICALAAGTFSGCGSEKDANAGGETKHVSWFLMMDGSASSVYQSLNEMPIYQELEKRTGIHIDFIHPPTGQEPEQFSLMIASRDLPDLITHEWFNYPGGPDKAIDNNLIIPLNDYMDSYAPNFKKWATQEMYAKDVMTDAGNYFEFPVINLEDARIFGGLILRGDWLKELNLSVPETIDEWDTVLRAFKEKKGATSPITGHPDIFTGHEGWNSGFDVGKALYVENGKVKYGPAEPAYKDYIAKLAEWYADGLIDRDYATNSGSIVDAKITSGEAGALFCYIGSGMGRYMRSVRQTNPDFELVAAPYPSPEKGKAPRFMEAKFNIEGGGTSVSTACKDPETAIKLADYFFSEEGRLLINFGIEGDTYNMVDGHPAYTDKILNNPEGYSISEAMGRYVQAAYPGGLGLKQDPDYLLQYYEYPQQTAAFQLWAKDLDNGRPYQMPMVSPTLDEAEEAATIKTEIDTYVDEMLLNFIQGIEPISNYDAFVAQLHNLKLDRYLELQQAAYDRYQAR